MGRHSQHRNHPGRQEGLSPDGRSPEDEQLIEPNRDAEDRMTPAQREACMAVHTDRDPKDDMRLDASQSQEAAAQH